MAGTNGQIELQPTPAAEWRRIREEGVVVPLPYSGFNAKIRTVALDVLIKTGRIPDILTSEAIKSLFQETPVEELIGNKELFVLYADIMDVVMPAAFMEPEVAMPGVAPMEHQIANEDIDYRDKAILFNITTAGSLALRLFRDQQAGNVQTVPNGQNDVSKSKRTRKPKRRPVDSVAI